MNTTAYPQYINTNIRELKSSSYMGHTVIGKSGKALSWETLRKMEEKDPYMKFTVELGGTYYARIFKIVEGGSNE